MCRTGDNGKFSFVFSQLMLIISGFKNLLSYNTSTYYNTQGYNSANCISRPHSNKVLLDL